jgi:peptidoglycan/xylan/chitin deacetylase (PgdA/CDA1 family)
MKKSNKKIAIVIAAAMLFVSLCSMATAADNKVGASVSPATKAMKPVRYAGESVKATPRIYVLCFHDIARHDKNNMTTSPAHLNDYITKLKQEGYSFLSLADYAAISEQKRPVPDKSIMLTFDDGYESFYKTVYPILKQQKVPAMMGIIGSWMDRGAGSGIKMSTWDQFREMEASGLVTIAAHSYDLHRPVPINDLGEQSQAAGSRLYRNGRYETEREYKERLTYDFRKIQKQLTEKLGHPVEAYVWPFGVFTEQGLEIGRQAGFKYFFQLSDGYNTPTEGNLLNGNSLLRARRIMIYGNLPKSRLDAFVRSYSVKNRDAFPVWRVNMSDLYVPGNESQTLNNVDQLIERLDMYPQSHIILNLAMDKDHNGIPDSVYFNNNAGIPVINNIAQHIGGRLGAVGHQIFIYIPWLEQWGNGNYESMREPAWQQLRCLYDDAAVILPNSGVYFNNQFLGAVTNEAQEKKVVEQMDVLMADNKRLRSQNNRAIVETPLHYLSQPGQLTKLLRHFEYLQLQLQAGKAAFPAWKQTAAAQLPQDKELQESLIFSFPVADKQRGIWYNSEDIRPYSDYLKHQGFRLFGYTYDANMKDSLWYLPNMMFMETDTLDYYSKA